ncbi:hypothetical protein NZK27_01740 [Synechococcus sp. FGCU-3]|nr:hypothetical protein [Synechococcus sp. FGCU3]
MAIVQLHHDLLYPTFRASGQCLETNQQLVVDSERPRTQDRPCRLEGRLEKKPSYSPRFNRSMTAGSLRCGQPLATPLNAQGESSAEQSEMLRSRMEMASFSIEQPSARAKAISF